MATNSTRGRKVGSKMSPCSVSWMGSGKAVVRCPQIKPPKERP